MAVRHVSLDCCGIGRTKRAVRPGSERLWVDTLSGINGGIRTGKRLPEDSLN